VTINWRRGFVRGWIVVTVCWILGIATISFRDKGIPSLTQGCDQLRDFVVEGTGKSLGDAEVSQCEAVWRTERLKIIEWAFGPPIALIVSGVLLGWIGRGFRSDP
jgi:hypothetical protein